MLQRHGLAAGPAHALVLQRVRERIDESAHGTLLLLAALRDDDRLAGVARLLAPTHHGRARAVLFEALDSVLPAPERQRLLPLLDDDPARAAAVAMGTPAAAPPSYDSARADVLAEGDRLTVVFLHALAGGSDLQHSMRHDEQPPEPQVLKQVERVLQLRSRRPVRRPDDAPAQRSRGGDARAAFRRRRRRRARERVRRLSST